MSANLICPKELLPNVGFNLTHIDLHSVSCIFTSPTSTSSTPHASFASFTQVFDHQVHIRHIDIRHLMSSTSTSSRSYTSSTAISSTSVQRLHISYDFLHCNLRNNSSKSCYTRVVAQEFLHRGSYTGVLTQEFLHGNCHTGVVTGVFTQEFTSRRATCICEFLRNYYFDFFIFFKNSGGSGSQAAGYET
jgi:hypothetical protein